MPSHVYGTGLVYWSKTNVNVSHYFKRGFIQIKTVSNGNHSDEPFVKTNDDNWRILCWFTEPFHCPIGAQNTTFGQQCCSTTIKTLHISVTLPSLNQINKVLGKAQRIRENRSLWHLTAEKALHLQVIYFLLSWKEAAAYFSLLSYKNRTKNCNLKKEVFICLFKKLCYTWNFNMVQKYFPVYEGINEHQCTL